MKSIIKGEFLAMTDYICILCHDWTYMDVNHNLTARLRQNSHSRHSNLKVQILINVQILLNILFVRHPVWRKHFEPTWMYMNTFIRVQTHFKENKNAQILKIVSYFVLLLVILVLTKQLFYNEMDAVIIFYCSFLLWGE